MSPRAWQLRINDILSCIDNIQIFTFGMNSDEFYNDAKTIRAVAFELITMGEAARAVPHMIQQQYPDIPWSKMQDIRNVIVHEYYRMDEEIIWETIRDDLPLLKIQLEQLIGHQFSQ
jgi:uncharacterized protein with HEPN domain